MGYGSTVSDRSALYLLAGVICAGAVGCELIIGPSWAINRALDEISEAGIQDKAEGTDLQFRFVSRTMEVEGDEATVFARGEASGFLQGVRTECICVEAIPFVRAEGGWSVDGFPLARLAAVSAALDARHKAFENRDVDAYRALAHADYGDDPDSLRDLRARLETVLADVGDEPVRQEILARTMRVERNEAIVTERWRLSFGEDDAGEEAVEGRARYVLVPTDDGWRFTSGLM